MGLMLFRIFKSGKLLEKLKEIYYKAINKRKHR